MKRFLALALWLPLVLAVGVEGNSLLRGAIRRSALREALGKAVLSGRVAEARQLLDRGADPSDSWSCTLSSHWEPHRSMLWWAFFSGWGRGNVSSGPMAQLLVDRGGRLREGAAGEAQRLLAEIPAGAAEEMAARGLISPEQDGPTTGHLIAATITADLVRVRAELDRGVSPGATDAAGWTALDWAVHLNRREIARELLRRGATPGPELSGALTALVRQPVRCIRGSG